MSPAEERNHFPSIISERFVNQSPKLLLVPRGQQGTGRQGRDRPVTLLGLMGLGSRWFPLPRLPHAALGCWPVPGRAQPRPVLCPPKGPGAPAPLEPTRARPSGHPRRESSPLPADQSPPAPATCLRSSSSVPAISYAHLTHRTPNRRLGRHWCPRQSPPSRWG